ncbi:hypothetical protein BDR26DRAFT_863514 [Obelidium mucronatum]|nr:hypothetical protein BDR26DRAFT_863514 [Obelidium mucronatum]
MYPRTSPFRPPAPPYIPPPTTPQLPLPPALAANPPRQFTPQMERELRVLPHQASRLVALQTALALDGWVGEINSVTRHDGVMTGHSVWSNATTLARHMLQVHRIFEHTDYTTRDPDAVHGRQDFAWLFARWEQEQQQNVMECRLQYQAKLRNSRLPENAKKLKCFCGICL